MDTPANQIPSFQYDIGKVPDIGSGYATGITEAGKSIAGAIGTVADIATQNRNADDTLQAMQQMKILSPDAYNAVAGKSLGAKQTLLGMYASQWIQQQAQQRELQKLGYTGAVQADVAHKQLLDHVAAIQGKYGPGGAIAAGVNVQKMPIGAGGTGGGGGGVGAPPAVQRAQLVRNPTAAQAATAATVNPAIAAPGQPLATGTSTPDMIIGSPIGPKDPIPRGAVRGVINGQPVFRNPDGRTIHPIIGAPQTATTGQIMSGGV